jgi:hypothetical protein
MTDIFIFKPCREWMKTDIIETGYRITGVRSVIETSRKIRKVELYLELSTYGAP